MKRVGMILSVAVLTAVIGGATNEANAGVNTRQGRQHERIANGRTSGELTAAERANAAAQQSAIRAEERYYRSTGAGLSARERADLRRDQNRASRSIYRQKHDGQSR